MTVSTAMLSVALALIVIMSEVLYTEAAVGRTSNIVGAAVSYTFVTVKLAAANEHCEILSQARQFQTIVPSFKFVLVNVVLLNVPLALTVPSVVNVPV